MSKRRRDRNVLGNVGLAVLAAGTIGVVASAFVSADSKAPTATQVQSYYESHTAVPTPTVDTRPLAVFVGDSYAQGRGASGPATQWVTLVSKRMGWGHVNLGRGGTGYVSTADASGCGLSFCANFQEMTEYGLNSQKPAIFVVSGGQNDFDDFMKDPSTVTAAIHKTYKSIRDRLPEAKIVAVGPSTPWTIGPDVRGLDRVVQDAATYVSLIEPNVIEKRMVGPDGAHVTDEGHAAIAERVASALR